MISNHLSLVEALRPKSNELAAQVDQYLAAGGKIEEAKPIGYKPKPITYSNQMPPAPKPFFRRRPPAPPQPLSAQDIRHQERVKQLERIREMAPTHTQAEVVEALGISRRTLYNIAQAHNLTFKGAARGRLTGKDREQDLEARDAKFAERIRAFLELGITRRQACGRLGIANKTFERIIANHGIDYPKARRGCTSCAA
jgi:DNA invertase Pin-like site-specific DNA recombinase